MSELQRLWARSKIGPSSDALVEEDDGADKDVMPELPEHLDDDSSSASSMSSTGTIIPSPNQNLFARPQGYAQPARHMITAQEGADFHQALHGGDPWSKSHGQHTLKGSSIYVPI